LLEVALRKGFFERPVSWMREHSPHPWRPPPGMKKLL